MLKYLLRFDQVDDRGCQASIFTEGPGSARQPGRRPRRSTAWCSSCSLQVCGRLLKPTGTVLRQVGHFIHVYYIWSNLMQSMAEECFELTFSSKVCEATNTISDEPTPKLDSAIETMCRKTGEVMRQLVKHEILQKWGVLWVPRWNISSCITNKITSPNQPNIWMPLCNNVFWHFFRGWGVIIGDSLAISRHTNCRRLLNFAICRQSINWLSVYRLSTFLPPRWWWCRWRRKRGGKVTFTLLLGPGDLLGWLGEVLVLKKTVDLLAAHFKMTSKAW